MHILEVIIDGFKSYATRTVVSGFDPEFNARGGVRGFIFVPRVIRAAVPTP